MKNKQKIARIVIMGLLTAILVVMSVTPLGYLNIGPLSITLNIIPVAIAALTMGPVGGAAVGAVFGLTSFLQCVGIGLPSPFGVTLFSISPLFTIITCFSQHPVLYDNTYVAVRKDRVYNGYARRNEHSRLYVRIRRN